MICALNRWAVSAVGRIALSGARVDVDKPFGRRSQTIMTL